MSAPPPAALRSCWFSVLITILNSSFVAYWENADQSSLISRDRARCAANFTAVATNLSTFSTTSGLSAPSATDSPEPVVEICRTYSIDGRSMA